MFARGPSEEGMSSDLRRIGQRQALPQSGTGEPRKGGPRVVLTWLVSPREGLSYL